uniref:Uncharacterized protein n=1 Tax=Eptatretus burgeri TaxID=7764 RepID=A0A8C4NJW7_EPTBU
MSHEQAFEDVPPEGVPEIFPELSSFTMHATRLMVSELRCRGANKSTEVAVQAILEFLNPPKPGEDETLGWTLLNTLHILAATNQVRDASSAVDYYRHPCLLIICTLSMTSNRVSIMKVFGLLV